jgi:hypothetical protein
MGSPTRERPITGTVILLIHFSAIVKAGDDREDNVTETLRLWVSQSVRQVGRQFVLVSSSIWVSGQASGPVVLYGCDTWSLPLREEHRLRVFQNREL